MRLRRRGLWLLAGLCVRVGGSAQAPVQPVQWTVAITQKTAMKPGTSSVIELSAEVEEGWHVYGLMQLPGGPTPLRVTLDTDEVAKIAGAPTGNPPVKKHDAAFDLDTDLYEKAFKLDLPITFNPHLVEGGKAVPLSVRFQACNDRVCLPPRTLHLSVAIEISPSK